MSENTYHIDSIAFESKKPYRGYTVKAEYLKEPHQADALVSVVKDGELIRSFIFPAYKVWNIAAHFREIVDVEIENSLRGYESAAWIGIDNAIFIVPNGADSL